MISALSGFVGWGLQVGAGFVPAPPRAIHRVRPQMTFEFAVVGLLTALLNLILSEP